MLLLAFMGLIVSGADADTLFVLAEGRVRRREGAVGDFLEEDWKIG